MAVVILGICFSNKLSEIRLSKQFTIFNKNREIQQLVIRYLFKILN